LAIVPDSLDCATISMNHLSMAMRNHIVLLSYFLLVGVRSHESIVDLAILHFVILVFCELIILDHSAGRVRVPYTRLILRLLLSLLKGHRILRYRLRLHVRSVQTSWLILMHCHPIIRSVWRHVGIYGSRWGVIQVCHSPSVCEFISVTHHRGLSGRLKRPIVKRRVVSIIFRDGRRLLYLRLSAFDHDLRVCLSHHI
jgi:hypothetical protein